MPRLRAKQDIDHSPQRPVERSQDEENDSEMSPIKDFQLVYKALNKEKTFSAGDTVTGLVIVTLAEETKVKSFIVKVKGDARVHWSSGSGKNRRTHSDHRRYFKLKEHLVPENSTVPSGVNRFEFSFKIPQGDMPPPFKGLHGRIVYVLEAKISRSWRAPDVKQRVLNFVPNYLPYHGQENCPQSGSLDKEVGVFTTGQVHLSATIDKKVCSPGDTLSLEANFSNSSSKDIRLKYNLMQRILYTALASRTVSEHTLYKAVGEIMTTNLEQSATCQLKIPDDAPHTIHNCEIILVEYFIKVYLDVSFASDPELKFPLVIVPSGFGVPQPGGAMGPYPAGAIGAPSNSDFPPPAFPAGPYSTPPGPGAYGYTAPNPTEHPNTLYPAIPGPSGYPAAGPTPAASGYNQWPPQAAPYGFPTAPFPPQHQAPTAPHVYHQEALPDYMSLPPPLS